MTIYLTGAAVMGAMFFCDDPGLTPAGFVVMVALWPITLPMGVAMRLHEIRQELREHS